MVTHIYENCSSSGMSNWNKYGTNLSATGGRAYITTPLNTPGYKGFDYKTTYDMDNKFCYMKFEPVSQQTTLHVYFRITFPGSNEITFRNNNGTLYIEKTVSGTTTTISSIAFDAVKHLWLRFRIKSGVVYFDAGPSIYSYSNIGSFTPSFSLATGTVGFGGGTTANEALSGAYFDDITLVSGEDKYWVGGTDYWNTVAGTKWSDTSGGTGGASIPYIYDNVYLDGNSGSGTITTSSTVAAADFDSTGFTGTIVVGNILIGGDVILGNSVGPVVYGGQWTLNGNKENNSITTNGNTVTSLLVQSLDGIGGYEILDDLIVVGQCSFVGSHFYSNGFDITATNLTFKSVDTNIDGSTINSISSIVPISINFSSSMSTFSNVGTIVNAFNTSNYGSSIYINGHTIETLNTSVANPGSVIYIDSTVLHVAGVGTFNDVSTVAHSIEFGKDLVFSVDDFNVQGTSGNLVKLESHTLPGTYTLSMPSGTYYGDYLDIRNSNATGGASWIAANNSVDGGNNTGWVFTAIGETTITFSSNVVANQEHFVGASANVVFYSDASVESIAFATASTSIIFSSLGHCGIVNDVSGDTSVIFTANPLDTYIVVVDDVKTYLYKVYNPTTGEYIGSWKDVKSELTFSQEINQAGSSIDVEIGRNSDSISSDLKNLITDVPDDIITDDSSFINAEMSSPNQIGTGSNIDLNLGVKIYTFYNDQQDIDGRLIFTGYISRYISNYGSDENTLVSLFSYGADLDNYILEYTGKTKVAYLSEDPTDILRSAFDIFNSDGGIITYDDGVPGTPLYIYNLMKNPSVETNLTGWTTMSGYSSRETLDGAATGTYYINLVNSGGGNISCESENLEIGKTYVFSVFIRKPAFGSIIIDGTHNSSIVFTIYPTSDPTWKRYSATIIATSATPLYIGFEIIGSDNIMHIDGVSLTDSSTLIDYFDGSTTDDGSVVYDWTGTANASTSRQTTTPLVNATVLDTGSSVSYEFNTNTMLEVVQAILKLAPTDWFWYIDMATNLIHFKPRPTEVSHTFTLGKHIKTLKVERSIENIVNTVYYSGGKVVDTDDYNLFKKYVDATSVSTYRRGVKKFSDERVKLEISMDTIAESEINRGKSPRFKSSITITDKVYDIESIRLGELVGFNNFGNDIDGLKMQIVRIDYASSEVTLQLDTLLPSVPKRLEDLKRNLEQANNTNNPESPDI